MLSATDLLEEARRISQLSSYGDMGFAEGLRVLIDAINREALLTPAHEATVKEELLRVLVNRLRMQEDITRHPEILQEVILPPVFITSIPRTGSTKLHRLLAATGDFNWMTFWHSYNFAPFPDTQDVTPDPRIAAADKHLAWLYETSPDYQSAHPQYTGEAEEELSLLDAGFNSLYRYAAMLNVPSYAEWVLARDGLQAFRDLYRMIQYLQWQHFRGRRRRWVLKTPSFFGLESSFAKVFKGADFIVTHRHPYQTMASTAQVFCGIRKLFSSEDFTAIAGETMLYNFGESLQRHLQWRDRYPAEKVLDVRFGEVIGEETELLQRIYSWLGMELTPSARANVISWVAMDARRGHRRCSAALEQYGISTTTIDQYLGPYIARYAAFF